MISTSSSRFSSPRKMEHRKTNKIYREDAPSSPSSSPSSSLPLPLSSSPPSSSSSVYDFKNVIIIPRSSTMVQISVLVCLMFVNITYMHNLTSQWISMIGSNNSNDVDETPHNNTAFSVSVATADSFQGDSGSSSDSGGGVDYTLSSPATTHHLLPSGQLDWSKYKRVHFFHSRKAAGTTLTKWVRAIALKHGIPTTEFFHSEGLVFDDGENGFLNETYHKETLWVTSLRPPVQRAISSYHYESVGATDFPTFVQTSENTNYGRRRVVHTPNAAKGQGWIWMCAANCYIKWFGGTWARSRGPNRTFVPDVHYALKTLDHFEIIFVNSLRDPAYKSWLLHYLNATDVRLPHMNKTRKPKKNFTSSDMELATHINVNDTLLYESMVHKWNHVIQLHHPGYNVTIPTE